MKKYLLTFLAVIMLVVVTGCGKKKESIVGEWKIDNIQNGPVTIIFGEDNSLTYKNIYFEATGKYSIEKDIVTFTEVWDDEYQFKYEIKDGKLTLTPLDEDVLNYNNMERVKK